LPYHITILGMHILPGLPYPLSQEHASLTG
jgi:hypothetical protein